MNFHLSVLLRPALGQMRHMRSAPALEAIHKVFLVDVITVDNLGPLVPVATLRAVLDS